MKLSEQLSGAAEDQIWRLKLVVSELSRYQDLLFDELVDNLGFKDEHIKNLLFDHLFNNPSGEGFVEYLKTYGH